MNDLHRDVATKIAALLYSDSLIPTDESLPVILRAVQLDALVDGRVPTDEEIDLLVLGGVDGHIPLALARRFQALDAALDSFF